MVVRASALMTEPPAAIGHEVVPMACKVKGRDVAGHAGAELRQAKKR